MGAAIPLLRYDTTPIIFPTRFSSSKAFCSSSFVCVAAMIVRMGMRVLAVGGRKFGGGIPVGQRRY